MGRSRISRHAWLLVLAAAGAGLLVAWWLWPAEPGQRGAASATPDPGNGRPGGSSATGGPGGTAAPGASPRATGEAPDLPGATPQRRAVVVSGQVTWSDGDRPAAGVDVIVSRTGAEWTATSDDGGAYSLQLEPGTYRVRAIGDGALAIGLPKLLLGTEDQTYDIRVQQQAVVRGRVRHQGGDPVAGTIVVPQIEGKGVTLTALADLGSAEAQSDGSFELFTLPGNLTLHATSQSAAGSAPVRALEPGEERDGIEIVLLPNGYVEGVVRGPDGQVIGDAKVLVSMQIAGTGEYDRIPVSTDDRGRFRYRVMRPSHTIVEATARGFAQSAPVAFRLEAGESKGGIVLELREADRSLSGQVLDSRGDPVAAVQVAQGHVGSKERYKKTYTDADGRFTISGLGPGPHRLRFRKSGYEQTRLTDLRAPRTDITVTLPDAGSD